MRCRGRPGLQAGAGTRQGRACIGLADGKRAGSRAAGAGGSRARWDPRAASERCALQHCGCRRHAPMTVPANASTTEAMKVQSTGRLRSRLMIAPEGASWADAPGLQSSGAAALVSSCNCVH